MKKEDGFATTLVPLDKIRPPLFQCRTESLDVDLDELVESIKTVGLLEPLTVRYDKDREPELVLGSRRKKASELAGLKVVPVIVRDLTDQQALEIEGVENLNRNDLSPEEKTRLCVEWAKQVNPETKKAYTAKEIPLKVHMSYNWVLTFLPDEYKDKKRVEAGRLGGEAKATTVVAKPGTCDHCHVGKSNVTLWRGRLTLCDDCLREATINEGKFLHEAGLRNGQAKIAKALAGKKVSDDQLSNLITCGKCGRSIGIANAKAFEFEEGKPMDLCPNCYDKAVHSKTERVERLHPKVGGFEDVVRLAYEAHGIPKGLQNEFITLPFRFGDDVWYLPKGVLAMRLNGKKAHEKRGDKDKKIVVALETLGVRVIDYTYENGSDEEKEEVLVLLEEKLKELGWEGNQK